MKAQNLWVRCHARIAVLFIFRSRLLLYSAGSGVNKGVLSGFSVRLFCFAQATTLCWYGCMHFLASLVIVCVDVVVMSSALEKRCSKFLWASLNSENKVDKIFH